MSTLADPILRRSASVTRAPTPSVSPCLIPSLPDPDPPVLACPSPTALPEQVIDTWSEPIDAPQNLFIISIPTVLDPSLAPPGKHLVHIYTAGNEPYSIWEGLKRGSAEYEVGSRSGRGDRRSLPLFLCSCLSFFVFRKPRLDAIPSSGRVGVVTRVPFPPSPLPPQTPLECHSGPASKARGVCVPFSCAETPVPPFHPFPQARARGEMTGKVPVRPLPDPNRFSGGAR